MLLLSSIAATAKQALVNPTKGGCIIAIPADHWDHSTAAVPIRHWHTVIPLVVEPKLVLGLYLSTSVLEMGMCVWMIRASLLVVQQELRTRRLDFSLGLNDTERHT